MYNFPIGIILESLKLKRSEAIKKAREIGVDGIQMYATSGENSPKNLTAKKRIELLNEVKDSGLCFSALCGDFKEGFWKVERNNQLIEKSKRILDLAKDLETNIVTTHIGPIPNDKNNERYKIMQEACFKLAEYADSLDAHFAIETGSEKSVVLKEFLDSLNSKGVAVNLDPANLVMVMRDDPVEAVYNLKDYIVHTHAKDGVNNYYVAPEIVYGVMKSDEKPVNLFTELPLGKGSVNYTEYLKALQDIGYTGFLTIEIKVGNTPVNDIKTAYDFLKRQLQI